MFPLYSILCQRSTSHSKLTLPQKKSVVTYIQNNPDKHSVIYALIKIHYNNERGSITPDITPYHGIVLNKEDMEFNLDEIPTELQYILYEYSRNE